jgi:hypothetical protein
VIWFGCITGITLFEETVPLAVNEELYVYIFAQYEVPVVSPVMVALVPVVAVQYVVALVVVP